VQNGKIIFPDNSVVKIGYRIRRTALSQSLPHKLHNGTHFLRDLPAVGEFAEPVYMRIMDSVSKKEIG
jgi:hypothetical protein